MRSREIARLVDQEAEEDRLNGGVEDDEPRVGDRIGEHESEARDARPVVGGAEGGEGRRERGGDGGGADRGDRQLPQREEEPLLRDMGRYGEIRGDTDSFTEREEKSLRRGRWWEIWRSGVGDGGRYGERCGERWRRRRSCVPNTTTSGREDGIVQRFQTARDPTGLRI